MSYRTILVDAGSAAQAPQAVAYAGRLAAALQAHLVGLASSGLNELAYQCNAVAPGVPLMPEDVSALRLAATEALARFTDTVTRLGVASSEARLTDDNLLDSMVLQSRYSDLVVIGQGGAGQTLPLAGSFLPQQLILHSPRPVLVVPSAPVFEGVPERPLLAWDGGMAASRAIEAALPLLRQARLATLAVFNAGTVYAAHGQEPGADLARFLTRHGVNVEVVVRDTGADVGDALLALAAEVGADLLVMGCYGHTRFRELLLGGTSRSILTRMNLPVLMTR